MENKYSLVKENLNKYNQEHLLKFYNELQDEEKANLLEDIIEINFEQVQTLFEETKKKDKFENNIIEPIKYIDKQKMTEKDKDYYNKIGEDCIKNNEYAVVTLAGGQRNKAWT